MSLFSSPSRHKLSCIYEHIGEDLNGIFTCNHNRNRIALCLEELVLPSSELIPPKEVAPEVDADADALSRHFLLKGGLVKSDADADADILQQFTISEHHSSKGTIMWNHMSNYVEIGNEYINSIHDKNGSEAGQVDPMGAA